MQPAESVPPPPKKPTESLADERAKAAAYSLTNEDYQHLIQAIVAGRERTVDAHTPVTLTIGQFWGAVGAILVFVFGAKLHADATYASKEALSAVAADVKSLTADVKGLDKRIGAVEVRLDGIDKRLDQLTEGQRQIAASVAQLDKTITSFIAVQQSRR
jgi:hypothetical protein